MVHTRLADRAEQEPGESAVTARPDDEQISAASLPEDVIGHTLRREGHVGEEIVKELARGRYDLVVLGSRGRGPAREGLFGSVNRYVHFHSRVPVLSVPDDDSAH